MNVFMYILSFGSLLYEMVGTVLEHVFSVRLTWRSMLLSCT